MQVEADKTLPLETRSDVKHDTRGVRGREGCRHGLRRVKGGLGDAAKTPIKT